MLKILKQIIALLNILLFSFSLLGQNTTKWLYDYSVPTISIEGNYLIGSPTVDNPFIESYFKGDYLGALVKKKTFGNLSPNNIFGAQNNFNLSYIMPANVGGSTVAYFFAVENKNIADLQFSDNLFKLFFAGNKQFAGDSIFVKNNELSFSGYSQLKGGIVKQFGGERFQHTFKGVLSFNIGTKHNQILIKNAKFFTDSEGELLDTDINFLFRAVKNNSPAFIKIVNGLGPSIDFAYNFKCDKGNNFTLALTDIGFLKWFKPFTSAIEKDTAFLFSGLNISDILNIEASTAHLNKDSLNEILAGYIEKKPYISFLPMSLQMYFYHEFNKRFELGAGMKHYLNLGHKPYYFIDAKLYALPQFLISPTLSYGGYAGFNFGLDLGFNFKAFNFYMGSDYITPLFANEQFRGKGYYFKIVRKLGYGPKSFESTDYVKVSKTPRKPKYNANVFSNSTINKISKFSENDSIVKP